MILLYISGVAMLLCVLSTLFIIKKRRYVPGKDALAVCSETNATALLGYLAIVIGVFILISKFVVPSLGGGDEKSYILIAVISLLCMLAGCFAVMLCYMKMCVAYPKKLVKVSVFGLVSSMEWSEIKSMKTPLLSRTAVFYSDHEKISVNGDPKQYRNFIKTVISLAPKRACGDSLHELLGRL